MKRFAYLALAGLTILAACDSGNNNTPTQTQISGTISGTVSIEGTGVSGVNVTLSSGATTTTASGGAYSFSNVPAGAYTVSIDVSGHADAAFSSTSKAATIATDGQVVPVDFSGSYIRTASISGSVSASGAGVAGVSVTAVGPDGTASKVTDANGIYQFTGLRAGSYTLTISNVPTGYTFTTTSATVSVNVGESTTAPFVGTKDNVVDQTTASVVIQSVTTGATNIPVNPAAVVGQINVTLQIDPGQNTLSKVCVLMDGNVVANGCQTLSNAVAAQSGAQKANLFEPVFSINTANFTMANGVATPDFLNAAHTLSAQVDLVNATQANVTTSMTLTTVNPDVVTVSAAANGGTATSGTGIIWHNGSVTATAVPVLYSGNTMSKVTMSLVQIIGGAAGAVVPGTLPVTVSAAPYTVTWPTSGGAGTTGNVGAASGPLYASVTSTVFTGGTNGPVAAGVPAQGAANYVVLDNSAPAAPAAWSVGTAGSNWWVGQPFTFAGVAPATPADFVGWDAAGIGGGVGGVACSFHVAAAGSTAAQLLAANAVTDMNAVGESSTNVAYNAIMNCWDGLTNGAGSAAASTIATNANPTLANAFGADLTNPINVKYTAGSPAANTVIANNATAPVLATYALTGGDALSGPGDTYGTLTELLPNGKTNCIVGAGASCSAVSDGGAGMTTTAADGYFTFNAGFRDLAGNIVMQPARTGLYDATLPNVQNIVLPATLPSGGVAQFTAVGTDNLDLKNYETRTIYNDPAATAPGGLPDPTLLPYSGPTMVMDANGNAETFGPPLTQTAQLSASVNFMRSIEFTAAAAPFTPTGTVYAAVAENFTARDWAGNSSTQQNNFAAGTVPAGSSATGLNITDWRINSSAGAPGICITAPCGALPASTNLTAVAGGMSGSFSAPYAATRVLFYRVDAGVYTYLGASTARVSADDGTGAGWTAPGTGREWTYSGVSFPAQASDAGTNVTIVAVGVDSNGDALITFPITITVT